MLWNLCDDDRIVAATERKKVSVKSHPHPPPQVNYIAVLRGGGRGGETEGGARLVRAAG